MFNDFENTFNRKRPQGKVKIKGPDVNLTLEIEFMEAIQGVKKQVTFQRNDDCSTCKGTGCRPGSQPTTCSSCNGNGYYMNRYGGHTVQEVCGACEGAGAIIRSPCDTCEGNGTIYGSVKEEIDVPRGVDSGVNLRVAKKGSAGQGGPPGDLLVTVKVKPHAYFKREGHNILTDCYLSLSQAVLGSEVKIKTLYGDLKLKVPAGTQHEEKSKLQNYGVQKLPPNQAQKGNHLVTFKIVIPKKLSAE